MTDYKVQTKQQRFIAIGGREILEKASKVFYDKVYEHPLLGKFFQDVDQLHIEKQQVDFMQGALGGAVAYSGKMVPNAHQHMYITENIFLLRQGLLIKSLEEVNAPQELIERWIRVEQAFKRNIVKNSVADCKKRYNTDELMIFS